MNIWCQGGQEKVSGPQVLELQTLVGQMLWCWALTLKPLEEQPEHLTRNHLSSPAFSRHEVRLVTLVGNDLPFSYSQGALFSTP